jgi:hypothetical protein
MYELYTATTLGSLKWSSRVYVFWLNLQNKEGDLGQIFHGQELSQSQ